ncbi:hypothetical protein BDQ17DRAFT_1236822 [Cyathus striatus]|nr:hypothetical protein BDQ17DRAFT_1236822 [Cyathus striatus]
MSQQISRHRSSHHSPRDEEVGEGIAPRKEGSIHAKKEATTYLADDSNRDKRELYRIWNRFTRKGKKNITVAESLYAIAFSSWLNILLILWPFAWASHFRWSPTVTFILSFLSIIPLERLFDYGGEQMAFYCGKELGDFIVITLNNAVEATLAIILLLKCELKLLQSTIIGVIVLHLLLIPGVSFVTGGARILEQDLHPQTTELNHTLLTVGVLSLLIPAAFFSALDRASINSALEPAQSIISDTGRDEFLRMSRGIAILLLLLYICSRVYLHNPPGDDNALRPATNAPRELTHEEAQLEAEDPELNQYVCVVMIIITVSIMAVTAEWLVESIEFVRERKVTEEWFGLILLPFVSFAADGTVAVVFFIRSAIRHYNNEAPPPNILAKARAIDLSVQFSLFWMPFFILLGWWTGRPMHLLFDFFEVSVVLGACFVVNYVTADAKTNWVEGFAMVVFYIIIALCAWYYPGQAEIILMNASENSQCLSVAEAISSAGSINGE